jgi:hypothetical protein
MKRIHLIFIGMLFSFLMMELIARFIFFSGVQGPAISFRENELVDDYLAKEFIPGAVYEDYMGTKNYLNSDGLRGNNLSGQGKYRVAIVGDSFTYGQGVNMTQTFPYYLEEATGHEVLNFGRIDFSSVDAYYTIKHVAIAKFKPDFIIYAYMVNDPLMSKIPYRLCPQVFNDEPILINLFRERGYLIFSLREYREDPHASIERMHSDSRLGWKCTKLSLDAMGKLSRESRIPVAILIMTPSVVDSKVVREAEKSGLIVLNSTLSELIGYMNSFENEGGYVLKPGVDGHYQPHVYKFIAGRVKTELERRRLVP